MTGSFFLSSWMGTFCFAFSLFFPPLPSGMASICGFPPSVCHFQGRQIWILFLTPDVPPRYDLGLPCRQRLSFSMSVWSVLPAPIYRARKFLRFPGIHHYPFPRVSTDQGQSVSEQFVSGRVPENNSKEISHRYEIGPLDQVISYL